MCSRKFSIASINSTVEVTPSYTRCMSDEITAAAGDKLRFQYWDVSRQFAKVTFKETEGWIPKQDFVSFSSLKDKVNKSCLQPLRLQQRYRQRKIAHMLEKTKKLQYKQEKLYTFTDNSQKIKFKLVNSEVIQPHTTVAIQVTPVQNVVDFVMIGPTESYTDREDMDILDGSYYPKHGGYIGIHNSSNGIIRLKKDEIVGEGSVILTHDLPFMDDETIELMRLEVEMPKSSLSCKEKSRLKVRQAIKKFDKKVQPVSYTHLRAHET